MTLLLWGLCTALAAGFGPPLPPPVAAVMAAVVVAATILARYQPAVGAALLAVVAAPLWLSAAGLAGSMGASAVVPGAAAALVLGGGLLLAVLGRGCLPRQLPFGVLALGAGLALREATIGGSRFPAPPLAGPLLIGAILVAGSTTLPARRQVLASLALGLAVLVAGWRGMPAWQLPPTSAAGVRAAARIGALDRHADALAQAPALGLYALSLQPTNHRQALALIETLGWRAPLDAGWRPETADLEPDTRIAIAELLDERGRGGEALRLLLRGRRRPEVAWVAALLARDQGRPLDAADQLYSTAPPAGTPRLPGRIGLDWTFLAEQTRVLAVQVDQPLMSLTLLTEGEPYEGLPELSVRVDAGPPQVLVIPAGPGRVTLPGPLSVGPHRLRLRFVNDASGEGGDRNLRVLGLQAP